MRDYDPTTGRYIEADPIGLRDGTSFAGMGLYSYASQNPLRFIDPSGLWPMLLPGRENATKNAPAILQQKVPALTPTEAQQVSIDAIEEFSSGDLITASKYRNSPIPNTLADLSDEQKLLLTNFLARLPDRDKDAVNKILKACEPGQNP